MRALLAISVVALLASCGFGEIAHGKDNNGYFKYQEVCVKSHRKAYSSVMPMGKMLVPHRRYRYICDSTETVKRYIKPQDIDKDWLKHNM